jgi:propanol-preferring alcohol dehydrogenase
VLVGLLSPELSFRTATIVRKQINILGSYGGTCADIKACLDLIAKGRLSPQVVTGRLEDFPTVLDDLHAGKIKIRIALVPEGFD